MFNVVYSYPRWAGQYSYPRGAEQYSYPRGAEQYSYPRGAGQYSYPRGVGQVSYNEIAGFEALRDCKYMYNYCDQRHNLQTIPQMLL